jgi:hypothetical protein
MGQFQNAPIGANGEPTTGQGSSDQQPNHAANQTNDCKSRNNPKIDQCATGLFNELASRIPSRGEIGNSDFKLSHGSIFLWPGEII